MPADTTEAQSTTLYEILGGAQPLRLAVDLFYQKVLGDPQLVHYFEGVDVARVKRHQVLLLSQVLGGPAEYTGRLLGKAHAGLDITAADYDRVVGHLVDTLEGLRVDASVLSTIEGVVAGVRPDIVAEDDDN